VSVGVIVLACAEASTIEFADLFLFNLRFILALLLGVMVNSIRAGTLAVAITLLVGSTMVAASTLALVAGQVRYEFYESMLRFGALGLAPNSAAALLAATFNSIPILVSGRPWVGAAAPLLLVALGATGSRAGALLAVIGLALWVRLLLRTQQRQHRWRARLLVAALLAAGLWWVVTAIQRLAHEGLVASVFVRLADPGSDVSVLYRLHIWSTVTEHLASNPTMLLFGHGAANAVVERLLRNDLFLETIHAHNLILQILTAYGMLGLAFWGWLALQVYRSTRASDSDALQGLRVATLTILASQLVDYGLWQEKFLLILGVLMGVCIAAKTDGGGPHIR
jgi:O-antigen ligase